MSDTEEQVKSLRQLSRRQLKDRWRELFKVAPPVAFTPDLLARGIAWRMQEKAFGGLSADARRVIGDGETRKVVAGNQRTASRPALVVTDHTAPASATELKLMPIDEAET